MNIGLIDVDETSFPNLVLMKLSAWYKAQGNTVELLKPVDVLTGGNMFQPYDRLIGACVFTRNMQIVRDLRVQGAEIAGIGTDDKRVLPDDIEHIMPDYSLYGITDTAYGFLSRGCPRGCPFCVVAGKEGKKSRKVADLSEWWSGQKNIVLCDPNILACDDWKDLLGQLAGSKSWIDVNQGFDARLLTKEKVEAINRLKLKMLHFAWDNPKDKTVPTALQIFRENSVINDYRKLQVYVLTNYWSTLEQDLYRVYWLRDNGYTPYVMIYNKPHAPKDIRRLQGWVNNKIIFRSCDKFEDYAR
jgi:hypothetical protein